MSTNYPVGRADPSDNRNLRFWQARQGWLTDLATGIPGLARFVGGIMLTGTGANAETIGTDAHGHLAIAQALPPTGVLGTGAGTGAGTAPTLTIAGTDQAGTIQVITGTQVPVAGATIVTVTFKTAMTTAPNAIIVTHANGATQALARAQDPVAPNTTFNATVWNLVAGTAALPASMTLIWWYWVV